MSEEREDWLAWLARRWRDLGTLAVGSAATLGVLLVVADDSRSVSRWMQRVSGVAELQVTVESLRVAVDSLVLRLSAIEEARVVDTSPIVEFAPSGHGITDAAPGGTVTITVRFRKMRNCGAPSLSAVFENGAGRLHAFERLSVMNPDGTTAAYPADPSRVVNFIFTARIPDDDGVLPGRGEGWVSVTYPRCADGPPVVSPTMPFTILAP